jgi:hypothetical protein
MKVMKTGVVLMVEMDVGAKRRRGQTGRSGKNVGEAIIISKWISASGQKGKTLNYALRNTLAKGVAPK